MKRTLIPLMAVVLLLILGLPADAFAAPPGGPPGDSDFSPTEIVVGFKPGVTPPGMAVVHSQAGGRAQHDIPALRAQVVSVPAGSVGNSIRRYEAHPLVEYAEPNYIAEAVGEPNDPDFDRQWGLHKVEAAAAWDVTTGSAGVSIAILDTGVDQSHPDLKGKIVRNVNFTNSSTVDDIHGHGTHVAGIAAASTNNAIGVAGMGYDSTIMNVKVLSDSGSGYYSWVASGITWAADNGAQVINMSLGGTVSSRVLEDAVNYAWDKGVVVVGAAGNNGNSTLFYPAAYANCMAVAATDRYDNKPSWSNHGEWVDVAAPGVGIYSTVNGDRYGNKSGTSMASPFVAGLAGLVFTMVTDSNSNGRLNDEVRARIESACDDIGVEGIGAGRINAARAVTGGDTEPEPEPVPGVEIVLEAEPASVSEVGTLVTYTYTVSNTGDVSLTGIAVTDDRLGSIATADTTLDPVASTTGTATYTITQADIDSGADIVNTATVTTDQGVTATDSTTVTVDLPDITGVTVSPGDKSERGWPSEDITYDFTVQNTGSVADTYCVSTASGWTSYVTPQSLTLEPEASVTITVTHTVPDGVSPGDFDTGSVNVLSAETGASGSAAFTTTARVAAVEITPGERSGTAIPGETVHYTYTISSTGTEDEVYDLTVSADWESSLSTPSVSLKAGGSAEVVVTHVAPEGAVGGDSDTGTLTAVSARASAGATFATTVEEEREPAVPVIDLFSVSDRSNPVWARVTVDWAVSDEDGDLATVEIVMVLDGTIVDSARFSVAGYEADGSCQLRHRNRQSGNYEITVTVTDTAGNLASATHSIRLQEKASARSR